MKSMRVAAVVAGSLVAAGAAAPAFAASELTPSSLNGAVGTVAEQTTAAVEPLANGALDTEKKGSLLSGVKGATGDLGKVKQAAPSHLLGGLPLGA
ncbi:hypothetical protein ACWGI8_24365 [Streptomyces sp. NPDC054841]